MIALVRGELAARRPTPPAGGEVVVDCGGIGYKLLVSAETLRHVPVAGRPTTLHAHMIVREDALQLYGFHAEEERDLFLALLGVQAVGPKMALAILSGGTPGELLAALAAGDVARLQSAPGVGKRTAERIVVELREKVGAAASTAEPITVRRSDDPRSVAREGLLGLGFTPGEVDALLESAPGASAEELIAHALRSART